VCRDGQVSVSNVRGRGALTNWRAQRDGKVSTLQESERGMASYFLESADGGKVRNPKASGRAESTHFLERAEGGTSQELERKPLSERHSPTASGECGGSEKLDTERIWANESTSGTHQLESIKGGTSQVTERRRASEGDSRSGGCERKDNSEHRKEVSEGTHFLESAKGRTTRTSQYTKKR
jgi:hypothetical protein